jgi:hypothetical protein
VELQNVAPLVRPLSCFLSWEAKWLLATVENSSTTVNGGGAGAMESHTKQTLTIKITKLKIVGENLWWLHKVWKCFGSREGGC